MSDGNEITQHSAKAKVFFQHFCNLIGDQGEAPLHFDLQAMYSADRLMQPEIAALEQPWTEGDIADAISSWKSNRSPGLDGFTGKFYNAFLNILIPDLKEVFTRLNLCPHDTLYLLNDSFIVLVPKKEPASTTHDYRRISLVNGVQKIYSKIMAAKLKPLLHKLLSPNQTGFLKHKSILHGFHYAQ